MKILVIGSGPWGRTLAENLAKVHEVKTIFVRGRSNWWDAPNDVAGVVVATAARTHTQIAEWWLSRGKPCWIEKPMAMSAADARRLVALAKSQRQVPVLVNHTGLWSPPYVEARRQIRATGEPILRLETAIGGTGPFRADCSPLWDWGPHSAAFAIDLLGRPFDVTCTADLEPELPGGATGLNYLATACYRKPTLTTTNGGEPVAPVVRLAFGNGFPELRRRLHIETAKSSYAVDLARGGLAVNGTPVAVDSSQPLTLALNTWLAAITDRVHDPRLGVELGFHVTDTLTAIERHLSRTKEG